MNSTDNRPRPLQLLAPARDLATAREAIIHGADAVYIGAEEFGARSRAGNSIEDIKKLVEFATPYNVRVYVTLNTIIYDDELDRARQLVVKLYQAGVDALIVQDMALLEMDLPPMALHASTQCDTRDAAKAALLRDLGFSQIVIARETSLTEIAEIAEAARPAKIEAFVHGALCVSYSGDCQASWVATGRSANRGECAQMCRLPYDLINGEGKEVGHQRHYLSLRDLNRIDSLGAMADAGVSSFKIEGRLKDVAYVKNVVAAYRMALDQVIQANPERYCRDSRGVTTLTFKPDVNKAFNRQFTDYFLKSRNPDAPQANHATPKSLGEPVGKVVAVKGRKIEADLIADVNNGDGLTYINRSDATAGGFRVNRAEGSTLYLADDVAGIEKGATLYRNYDRLFDDLLNRDTAKRKIPIDFVVSALPGARGLCLKGEIEGVGPVSVAQSIELQPARTPDNGRRRAAIEKLGDTPFQLHSLTDLTGDLFVPASVVSNLRRDWVEAALTTLQAIKEPERNLPRAERVTLPEGYQLTRHDNVANRVAARFIGRIAGVAPEAIEPATECKADNRHKSNIRVMTTRYCLRRELGACLKQGGAKRLPGPLYLRGKGLEYRLDFDCSNCRMQVIANPT